MSNYSDLALSLFDVAYWRLGEASGTTAVDAVGGHDGTYSGGVTLGAPGLPLGDTDTAASFDGVDGVVTFPDLGINGAHAAAVLYRRAGDAQGPDDNEFQQLIRSVAGAAASSGSILVQNTGGDPVEAVLRDGTGVIVTLASAQVLAIGETHLIGYDYDGSSLARLIVDGVVVDTAPCVGLTSGNVGGTIGRDPGGDAPANGVIDEVGIASRILTAAEWAALWSEVDPTPAAVVVTVSSKTTVEITVVSKTTVTVSHDL